MIRVSSRFEGYFYLVHSTLDPLFLVHRDCFGAMRTGSLGPKRALA